ncbi:hypothetical protein E2C01_010582 [Portunus trituberculatus]|uniref:Uncharacterized protein n=1 Tax=Portunus trituberculatus TaxID=210409 RepID=A0A5B7D8S0_PORTR|nr:hypothetical protein [Portunus trituberculatus]
MSLAAYSPMTVQPQSQEEHCCLHPLKRLGLEKTPECWVESLDDAEGYQCCAQYGCAPLSPNESHICPGRLMGPFQESWRVDQDWETHQRLR